MLSHHNSVLSQKQESRLCLVQPSVDMEMEKLTLAAQGCGSVEVPLNMESVQCAPLEESGPAGKGAPCPLVRVCGDR